MRSQQTLLSPLPRTPFFRSFAVRASRLRAVCMRVVLRSRVRMALRRPSGFASDHCSRCLPLALSGLAVRSGVAAMLRSTLLLAALASWAILSVAGYTYDTKWWTAVRPHTQSTVRDGRRAHSTPV